MEKVLPFLTPETVELFEISLTLTYGYTADSLGGNNADIPAFGEEMPDRNNY